MELLITALLIGAGLWVVIALAGVLPLGLLLVAKFRELHGEPAAALFDHAGRCADEAWLEQQGFRRAGVLENFMSRVAGWSHEREARFVAVYFVGGQCVIDLVTEFGDGIILTTASTRDGMIIPRPRGQYMQAFPKLGVRQLFEKHRAAEASVREAERPGTAAAPRFEEAFQSAVEKEARRVLSRPWIWMLIPWWYFVRRHRWVGVTVPEQLSRGWFRPRRSGWFG